MRPSRFTGISFAIALSLNLPCALAQTLEPAEPPQTMAEALQIIQALSKENVALKNRMRAEEKALAPPPPAKLSPPQNVEPATTAVTLPALPPEPPAEMQKPRPTTATPSDYVIAPHVDAFIKGGNERTIAGTEAFVPLSWNGKGLAFMDARFVGDDQDAREGNFGLGYRWVPEMTISKLILGAYGFYDRRKTETGNQYAQATLGAEFMTEKWDGRVNSYSALSDEKVISRSVSGSADLSLSGNNIVAHSVTTQSETRETPLSGFDLELGRALPYADKTFFGPATVHAGGFYFDADNVESMSGYRTRLNFRPLKWLEFGAEFQNDNIRGDTYFTEARVRIPLGKTPKARKPQGIYARLDERIIRDIDIVTQDQSSTPTVTEVSATVENVATGAAQEVYIVDNTAAGGGNGTPETPYNSLSSAMAVAGANDIVYVRAGNGTTAGYDLLITLDDQGQSLIGSGSGLAFDDLKMTAPGLPLTPAAGAVIIPAGAAPILTNSTLGQNVVNITAANVTLKGVTIEDSKNIGINVAHTADNTTISGVTVRDSVFEGLTASMSGAAQTLTGLRIENSTFEHNGRYGIQIVAAGGALISGPVLSGLSIEDSGSYGTYIQSTGAGSSISNLSLTGSAYENNADSGLYVNAVTSGAISQLRLSDLSVVDSGSYGVYLEANGAGATMSDLSFTGSVLDGNADYGLYFLANNGATIANPAMSGLTIQDSGSYGAQIYSTGVGSAITNLAFTQSVFSDNAADGLYVQALSSGVIAAPNFVNLTAADNRGSGFAFITSGGNAAMSNMSLRDSLVAGNDDYGMYVGAGTASTISAPVLSNLTIQDNGISGLYVYSSGAGAVLSGASVTDIVIQESADQGLYVFTQSGGVMSSPVFSGLTIEDSGADGAYFLIQTAGSVLSNLSFTDSAISSSDLSGVYLLAQTGGVATSPTLSGLNVENSGTHGINVTTSASGAAISGLSLTDSVITDSANSGIVLAVGASSTLSSPVLSGLTINGSRDSGLNLSSSGAAAVLSNLSLTDSSVHDSSDSGLLLSVSTGGTFSSPVFSGLDIDDSGEYGAWFNLSSAGSALSNLSFTNNSITDSDVTGIYVVSSSGAAINSPVFSGLTIADSGGHGIYFNSSAASATISNISLTNTSITDSANGGLQIVASAASTISAPVISGLTIQDSGDQGAYFQSNGAAAVLSNLSFTGSSINETGDNALYVYAESGGVISSPVLSSLSVQNSGEQGVYFRSNAAGSSISSPSFANSSVSGSAAYGLISQATTGGAISNAAFSNLTIEDSGASGVYFNASGAAAVNSNASLSNSVIFDSSDYGVFLQADGGGAVTGSTLSGLEVSYSGEYGFYARSTGAGSSLPGFRLPAAQRSRARLTAPILRRIPPARSAQKCRASP